VASVVGQPIYENGLLSKATGDWTLRPGGLDLTERLLALCELPVEPSILDVGCGVGGTVEYLLEIGLIHVTGIDRSELLLRNGIHQYPKLSLACAFGETLPIEGNRMDAILAECSLSAMSNTEGVLTEFHRVLRPDGKLALSDVYVRNPEGLPALRTLPLNCGVRDATTRAELMARLQARGFEILAWEDHTETLKYLAAQIIFSHGSMDEFWCCSESGIDPMDIQIAIRKAKLGYYLLAAKKT
jgi:arsenite methyltransferase